MGEASDLDAFVLDNWGDGPVNFIDMSKSVPISAEFAEDGSEFWGTEFLMDFSKEDNWVSSSSARTRAISFHSKWDAPYLWIDEVIKQYPSISFKLEAAEIGNAIYVLFIGSNGVTKVFNGSKILETMTTRYFDIVDEERGLNATNYASVSLEKFMAKTPYKEIAQFLLEEGLLFEADPEPAPNDDL